MCMTFGTKIIQPDLWNKHFVQLPAWTKTKTNCISVGNFLIKSSSLPVFNISNDFLTWFILSNSFFTATSIKRWNELTQKWIILIPFFSFAYHTSFSSDVLLNYWLVVLPFPFRDGNSNGPITQKSLLSHLKSNSKKISCNDNIVSLRWENPMCFCVFLHEY